MNAAVTSPEATPPAYKDVTLRQLKSFCETARLGSLTAAARELRIAHPTVWKQVHALEVHFKVKLVETHVRGCTLTDDGRVLAELASPLVTDIDQLREQFAAVRTRLKNRLGVVSSSRILIENLPDSLLEFTRSHPDVQVILKNVEDVSVPDVVESGEADLGLTGTRVDEEKRPLLSCRLCVQGNVMLVTPKDHPLAKKARVKPADLARYPLVNSPASFRDPALNSRLQRYGLFNHPARRVEADAGIVVLRYVALGFGIGLVGRPPGGRPLPGMHERSMAEYFGHSPVYLVTRRRPKREDLIRALAEVIQRQLEAPRVKSSRKMKR